MSERSLRRRGVVSGGRIKSKPPTPRSYGNRSSSRCSKSSKVMERSSSEPLLWSNGLGEDLKQNNMKGAENGVLFRPQTCSDIFASSPSLLGSPPSRTEGYNKDAKVVVNVTVEGSPGPIRTMVKLGASVEETIRIVVEKYAEEGRTPKFDRDLATGYELHQSHFSLQSLEKSEVIGDVGSRSFYLRRNCRNQSSNFPSTSGDSRTANPAAPAIPSPIVLFPAFIAQSLSKLLRKAQKLWRILLCFQCE